MSRMWYFKSPPNGLVPLVVGNCNRPTCNVLAVKMALVADTALNHYSLTHSLTH